jgi:type VI protein secretion system component VasF
MPVMAFGCALIMFVAELLGFRGKYQPMGTERQLNDIWWHFPSIVAVLLLLFMFWPCRFDRWDDI